MQVSNTRYYNDQDFADYLAMPGYSFSTIKNDCTPLPVSEGMRLGTRVHNYILEPDKYDWQQVSEVKAIAAAIREYVGASLAVMQKEVAFTSEFEHNGMVLNYKGRTDLLRIGRIVVDLKILAGPLQQSIERFQYDKQLSGYCLATGSPTGLIIAYNKAKKVIEIAPIKPNADFWEYQCVRLGTPATEIIS